MHIADEKPIQPLCHLNTGNTCQNSEILYQWDEFSTSTRAQAQAKETWKQSSVFKYIHFDKKL